MLVTAEGCDLDIDRGPDWLFVRIRNFDADAPESSHLADRIWALLEKHLTYRLVLELDDIEVLPSLLIAQMERLHGRIREHDGVIRLSGLSAHSRKLLHRRHLEGRLPAYGDRIEALMGMPGQPR